VSEAQTLFHQGRGSDAEPLIRKAMDKDDTNGAARMWLGLILEQRGQWQNAIYAYEAAIAPGRVNSLSANDAAMVHNNLGLLYRNKQNRHDDAEAQYLLSNAAAERGGLTGWIHSYKNLARLLEKNGRAREAMPFLDIVADKLKDDALRYYSALLLPYVYQDTADIDEWRKSFKKNLRALAKRGISITNPFMMEGVPQYYLSYHGRNDVKINSEIARLFRRSCQVCAFKAPHTIDYTPVPADKKVRVGFISYYFREHSVSKMTLGLLKGIGLHRDKFHTVLYQFGYKDHITEKLAAHMNKFMHLERGYDLQRTQRLLADEQLDVLVFPEIGMDPHAYSIAFGRYAPIQIAMHGHAQTTGVSTLDYYVSYKGFSEPKAQSHYSEKLLIVDGYTPLTRYYDLVPHQLSPHLYTEQGRNAFKARFRIPSTVTVYACLQTIFKVDPRMDQVALRILEGDGNSVVLFKELPMTDQVAMCVCVCLRERESLCVCARVRVWVRV
jgi:predicted O-linked N-acetylglucosamine transferase (SPINDLY family)